MAQAQTELSLWYHGAGSANAEEALVNQVVADFNASQSDWKVVLETFPQLAYNDAVGAAALADELPDILDVDGPVMPNWAWAGYMQPLGIDEAKLEGFLPGTIGRWNGEIYSVGLWDAAVAMMARRSVLEENGIRIPTLEEPWTREEFDGVLQTLKDTGEFDYPLDLGMAWKGEWYPYAFSPFLQSFGGDIVDRDGYQTAEGVLNGDAAIEFGEWWQGLFENDMAPGTSQDAADRETGFLEGKYALSWNGNWAALPVVEKFGDDALFLPAPDFGEGPVIGGASWQFGIAKTSEHPEGARAFIEFAIQPKYLSAFSDGTGLIPSTADAAADTANYNAGGALEVFYELSENQAKLRPVTPGYIVQAKVFEKALADIANGADVIDTLDAAVDEINEDIENNQGYGH
ncbi:sugar ABC transporter substrate-binding protein [Pseudoponticoccus marisrubri]|uniref:Sugar-binding protein n=1 Tax=Pseudoponticoccus marisrubri TaxID=1685382 RepID=A0A0W7WK09_9RHOB|nr:extracellular solute-binding protein [Pseudoponticoccus marisrubri]KUF10839.1 sugar-binding protein [Pseudoponticoccus marisrubri]